MQEILINVKDKIAKAIKGSEIVCDNTDYFATFNFDPEWDEYRIKTVYFRKISKTGRLYDFEPVNMVDTNTIEIPRLIDAAAVMIGVSAGNLRTTTGATIVCIPSIHDGTGGQEPITPSMFEQIMALLNEMMVSWYVDEYGYLCIEDDNDIVKVQDNYLWIG